MLRRVAIVGPESTGKSDLARMLARDFEAEWVPEYARFYLDRLDREYDQNDLLQIAKGQLIWEDDKAEYTKDWLFCDTNLLVIKVWSDFKYGSTDPWIEEQLNMRKYDFYLLNNIDLPWIPDPQREHPNKRKELFDIYHELVSSSGVPYSVVNGIEGERLSSAKKALEQISI